MTVVRFPVEQTRLPGEPRAKFERRQADEQYRRALVSPPPDPEPWTPPVLDDLANGRTDE